MKKSASSAAKTTPEKQPRKQPWILILIFRLLLLGVGGSLAMILGIVFANVYPAPKPEKPLMFKLLDRLDNKPKVRSPNSSPIIVPEEDKPSPEISPGQKQQAQAKVTKLQAQLKELNEEVANLETQLGTSRPNEDLEARLQAIAQQLQGSQSSNADASPSPNDSTNQVTAASESVNAGKLKVTLPSDLLFEESKTLLRSDASAILDKIVADLRNYPGSTIRIAAHTDTAREVEENRELSFRRAKAVEQYLSNALGSQYRWLAVGYGNSRPLVTNDSIPNQQRNRRVEIAVD